MDIPERLHDSMLWKYAVVSDGLYLINRQLILYRRHESNATNQFRRVPPNVSQRIKGIEVDAEMFGKFLEASDGLMITPSNQNEIRGMLKFMERRRKILEARNPITTAIFVIMNLKYYSTFRSAMSDIYAVLKLRE